MTAVSQRPASLITFEQGGSIAATNVRDAILEAASEAAGNAQEVQDALDALTALVATDSELAVAVATLTTGIAAKQDAATAATDAELASAIATINAAMATDAELASAVSALTTSIGLKQDALTAATDAELAAAVAAINAVVATDAELTAAVSAHNASGAAHADIRTLVGAETTARTNADTALDGRLATVESSRLIPTAVKTSNYSATANDYVPVDTTSGTVTVTLPSAPADGVRVGVKHVIQGGTNAVTVARGGSDVFNKAGGSTSLSLPLLNQGFILQYKASTGIWYAQSGDTPLSQLDARFLALTAVDTDTALAANSDARVTSQKAIKAYVDAGGGLTKRVTAPISVDCISSYSNIADWAQRVLLALPVTTTRWRLRVRNISIPINTANTGAISFAGVWLGTPAYAATGLFAGNFTATPTNVLGSFATAANGADYTSTWVTDAAQQFAAGVTKALAWGCTCTLGTVLAAGLNGANLAYGSTGAGAAAIAGQTSMPSGGGISYTGAIGLLDVRLEYEFSTLAAGGTPTVLCVGDSITSGYMPSGGLEGAGVWPHETWPGAAGLRQGFCPINGGVGSSTAAQWAVGSDWRWGRFDLATTVPDFAILGLGSNDLAASVAATTIEANLVTIIDYIRTTLGISRVFLGTIIPRNFGATPEAQRVALNLWQRKMPRGVIGVFDFDKAIYRYGTATADTDFLLDADPHPTHAGYQKMAGVVLLPARI